MAVMGKTKSGPAWVNWANVHEKESKSIDDLVDPFKSNVKAFLKALTDAGVKDKDIEIQETKRSAKRAYLFHWSWLIGLGKAEASEAKSMAGVEIEWDHGDPTKSKNAANVMIDMFGLAVPPN